MSVEFQKIKLFQNTFIFLFSLISCSVSYADTWLKYWENSEVIAYYEPFSILYSNREVEIQLLNDYKEIQYTEKGEKYSSTTVIKRINCETKKYTSVYLMVWQLPKAEGKAIYINHKEYGKNSSINENSNMASVFEIACRKPLEKIESK
jgi:hypothetical protein